MARIVIADDDVDIRDLVEFKLTTEGHSVVAVTDGAATLEACRREPPDLVVLDVTMPGLTGLEVLDALRADPVLEGLPVVLLSARAQESDQHAGLARGADAYITKPFSPRELAAKVASLLG